MQRPFSACQWPNIFHSLFHDGTWIQFHRCHRLLSGCMSPLNQLLQCPRTVVVRSIHSELPSSRSKLSIHLFVWQSSRSKLSIFGFCDDVPSLSLTDRHCCQSVVCFSTFHGTRVLLFLLGLITWSQCDDRSSRRDLRLFSHNAHLTMCVSAFSHLDACLMSLMSRQRGNPISCQCYFFLYGSSVCQVMQAIPL